MQSIITSKYQTTIPKAIRENLGLSVKDALEWKVEKSRRGSAIVTFDREWTRNLKSLGLNIHPFE